MSTYDYDLFVIGAGSGGVRCARISASMGARVAVAEERYMGGTCVNVGCVPKKLYVYGSHMREDIELAPSFGWSVNDAQFDWQVLRENKVKEINRLNGIYRNLLSNAGCDVMESRATVSGPNSVVVAGKTITAKHILIATGGWPFKPDIPGIEHSITSNEFFDLPSLPDRALVVGGGYIAIELACILHNLGVETTLSYRRDLFLRGFDQDIRQHLRDELVKKGLNILFNHDVTSINKRGEQTFEVTDYSAHTTTYNLILYATGRKPKVDGLGLENTKVVVNGDGAIQVNEHYQTNQDSIYAVGDVTDRVQLTPVALAEGMYLANYLFGSGSPPVHYDAIPTAVFTQPPIGTVGLSEQDARAQGYDVKIFRSAFAPMKYSFKTEKERSLMKLVVDAKSDRVLGAHMVGPDAGEIIQGIGIAVGMGATKAQFDQTIGIHPTSAEEFVTMRTPVETISD